MPAFSRARRHYLKTAVVGAGCIVFSPSSANSRPLLVDQAGNTLVIDNAQKRWLLINLWATWCAPCLIEIPDLVRLHQQRATHGLNIVGVVQDWTPDLPMHEPTQRLKKRLKIEYPNVPAAPENLRWFGSNPSVPSTALFRPDGRFYALHQGLLTDKMILSAIRSRS